MLLLEKKWKTEFARFLLVRIPSDWLEMAKIHFWTDFAGYVESIDVSLLRISNRILSSCPVISRPQVTGYRITLVRGCYRIRPSLYVEACDLVTATWPMLSPSLSPFPTETDSIDVLVNNIARFVSSSLSSTRIMDILYRCEVFFWISFDEKNSENG